MPPGVSACNSSSHDVITDADNMFDLIKYSTSNLSTVEVEDHRKKNSLEELIDEISGCCTFWQG